MKKLLILLVLGGLVWQFYFKQPDGPVITNINADGSQMSQPVIQQSSSFLSEAAEKARASAQQLTARAQTSSASTASYRCDGRKHCSQMRSCDEAKFFLRNCPGVKMDGNNDGVPCEQQWCR
jgi:hypothetical protein